MNERYANAHEFDCQDVILGNPLPVPFRSQEDADAYRFRNDCGPASAAMCIEYLTGMRYSIDALSADSPLAVHDNGLTCQELARLINGRVGRQVSLAKQLANVDEMKERVLLGLPTIPLINYGKVPNRQNLAFLGGHFFAVKGFNATHFIVSDPDWWGSKREQGANFLVKFSDMDAAIRYSPAPMWGIVFEL